MRRYSQILALVFGMATGAAAAPDAFFTQGIALNQAGQLPEAAAAYQKSLAIRPAAGTLVNLGITEWQSGHAGAAILAWEQARGMDPFDARAIANLAFARAVTQVNAPELKWFETASTWLPANAWVWLAGAGLWLGVGMLTLPAFFRRRKTSGQQALAALGFGIFLLGLTANVGVVSRAEIGFVLKRNAPLLLTPTHTGEVISTLTAGEAVRRVRVRGDYYFIRTANEAGWIQRDQLGLLFSAPTAPLKTARPSP